KGIASPSPGLRATLGLTSNEVSTATTRLRLMLSHLPVMPKPLCGIFHYVSTQGSAFRATLGWEPESRWDFQFTGRTQKLRCAPIVFISVFAVDDSPTFQQPMEV